MELHVITFGFGHNEPLPEVPHILLDARKLFKDPHGISKEMRTKTAKDPEVVESVMRQPGARGFALNQAHAAVALGKAGVGRVVLAVGCTGGKHRAPALGEAIARRADQLGATVTIDHRHIDSEVIAH